MTRAAWKVIIPGYRPFTLAGEPITRDQALAIVRSIWPDAEIGE